MLSTFLIIWANHLHAWNKHSDLYLHSIFRSIMTWIPRIEHIRTENHTHFRNITRKALRWKNESRQQSYRTLWGTLKESLVYIRHGRRHLHDMFISIVGIIKNHNFCQRILYIWLSNSYFISFYVVNHVNFSSPGDGTWRI